LLVDLFDGREQHNEAKVWRSSLCPADQESPLHFFFDQLHQQARHTLAL
jgi:hypothetical protein